MIQQPASREKDTGDSQATLAYCYSKGTDDTSRSYPKEKHILKQVRALNDRLIIEAINLFNAEVRDVI